MIFTSSEQREQRFAIMSKEDMLTKMEDHIGGAVVVDSDPTTLMMGKFQRAISKLKKDNKIDKHTFYKLYPSDAVPPRLYGYLKAHKPQKNYPMRPIYIGNTVVWLFKVSC
jgi:hypothetical protein